MNSLCKNLISNSLLLALSDDQIDRVVIGGFWTEYFHASAKRYLVNGNEKSLINYVNPQYKEALNRLTENIRLLTSKNKKVYFIKQSPGGIALDPKYMFTRKIADFPNVFSISLAGLDQK